MDIMGNGSRGSARCEGDIRRAGKGDSSGTSNGGEGGGEPLSLSAYAYVSTASTHVKAYGQ
eukprot:scaffold74653_cov31-Tisochrysis_lutea.AAC.1